MKVKAKCGTEILIDDEDFGLVSAYVWTITDRGYAHCITSVNGKTNTIRMHRLIMGCETHDKIQIDHINCEKLDNRKSNLRKCDSFQNMLNVGMLTSNTSGFKGVCWVPRKKKWVARISFNGKRQYLGFYKEKYEAYFAYCCAAVKIHKEFANFGDHYANA